MIHPSDGADKMDDARAFIGDGNVRGRMSDEATILD